MNIGEDGARLVREVHIAAPREIVFRYFTDPARLVAWIGIAADLDPRADGSFRFEVAAGEFCSGRYVEVDPPRRVVFTWGWESAAIPVPPGSTVVEVDLHEAGDAGDATHLVLTHRGLAGDTYHLHDEGWQAYLARLQAVVEGRDPGPDPAARTPAEALDGIRRRGGSAVMQVTSSLEVDRPAAEAFAFIADAENNPKWQKGMRSCRWTTEPPIRIGSIYAQEATFLGKPITSTFEVVAFEPDRSITIRTITSTFPIEVTRSAEPLSADRCRVCAVVRGDPSGVFRIATPLLRRIVQRSVRGDYRRLKTLLER